MDADDMALAPKIVMRDNDKKLASQFTKAFQAAGAEIKRNTESARPCRMVHANAETRTP